MGSDRHDSLRLATITATGLSGGILMGNVSGRRAASLGRVVVAVLVRVTMFASARVGVGVPRRISVLIRGVPAR